MRKDDSKIAYLDANFLVDWFIRKQPALKKRARILLAKLLTQSYSLAISPLTIDESWKGIKIEADTQKTYSYSEDFIFSQIKNFTEKILTHSKINIIQLQNLHQGILEALDSMKKFSLPPRDAFHLSIMKDHKIFILVTRDDKFIKQQSQMGLKVIIP